MPVSVTLIQPSASSFVQVPNHGDSNPVGHPLFGPIKHFADRYKPGISTYSVVPLNEGCDLIEWVRNTIHACNIFKTLYDRRNLTLHVSYEYYLFVLTDLLRYLGKGGNDVAERVKTMSGEDPMTSTASNV